MACAGGCWLDAISRIAAPDGRQFDTRKGQSFIGSEMLEGVPAAARA